jgi:hypothetical protein
MAIHYNGDRFVGVAPPTENHGFLCSENEKRLGKRGRGREGGGRGAYAPARFWRVEVPPPSNLRTGRGRGGEVDRNQLM